MNYEQFMPALLAVFGAGLQWIRQHRAISDTTVGVFALIAAASVYALVHVMGPDWRMEVIQGILFIGANLATVVGGTALADSGANGKLAGLIPKANSR